MDIERKVTDALKVISLPSGENLIESGFITKIALQGDGLKGESLSLVIEQSKDMTRQQLSTIRSRVATVLSKTLPQHKVDIIVVGHRPPPDMKASQPQNPSQLRASSPFKATRIEGIKHIVAIGSGKGGVGKSTLTINLAVALAHLGRHVGVLDGDIYGPSVPQLLGNWSRPPTNSHSQIVPLSAHGIKFMSIGLMVEKDQSVVWRGPMLMKTLQQMFHKVAWGQLDVLLVDLPPGTGDVQLTLCQNIILSGAIIVSTPQDVALLDARKAMDMFDKMKVNLFGLVENMGHFTCPHCQQQTAIFGHQGVQKTADEFAIPYLGQLPLALDIRESGDSGTPITTDKTAASALCFYEIAQKMIDRHIA